MGNGQFLVVFYQNLLMQLKQWKRNIMLVVIPVVVFFFMSNFFSMNEVAGEFLSPIKMAIVDLDNSAYSDMVIESFKNNEYFTNFVEIIEEDEEEIREDFEDAKIDVMIVVPEGFVENLAYFEELPLEVLINFNDPVKAVLFKNVIVSYEQYIRSVETGVVLLNEELKTIGIDKELRWAYYDRLLVNLIFTAMARNTYFDYHEIVDVPSTIAVKYYFISLMVMFMMYLSIFSAVNLIREKQDMCLRRLRLTNVKMFWYFLAKSMANSIYMFMVIGLWFILFAIFYGSPTDGNPFTLMMFILVCVFFNVVLALLFTIFFDSEEPVVLLGSIFIFMNAVLGGSIIPIHSMSFVIQRLAKLTPNYWMIKGILYLDSAYKTDEILQVGIVLMLIAVAFLGIISVRYSRKEA